MWDGAPKKQAQLKKRSGRAAAAIASQPLTSRAPQRFIAASAAAEDFLDFVFDP
jgi:hypothetical protein